ncbi:MAG: hypothetical protein ACOZIN_04720 [Myxococcota bacterium]
MLRLTRFAVVAAAVFAGAYVACSPPPPSGLAVLSISASPRQIDDQGETSTISVEALTASGALGSGTVTFSATAGSFTSTSATLDGSGKATTQFSCAVAANSRCSGSVRITAEWDAEGTRVTNFTSLTVGTGGGGGGDGGDGGEAFDGGTTDGGGGTVTSDSGVSGDGGIVLTLSASRQRIFLDVGDFANVTATLRTNDGGPIADQDIEFTSGLGGFTFLDGGTTPMSPLVERTGPLGTAVVQFRETGVPGTTTLVGKHDPSGATSSVSVEVLRVQQIRWISTKCNGIDCNVMGIKGSGFNEQAQVTFEVVDSSNRPAPGVSVRFSIANPPAGATVTPTGITDTQGRVTVNVSAGTGTGAINVHAVVITGLVEADSQTIGIRGAKPANEGFTLQCGPVNVAAYASPQPPLAFNVNCNVKLVDRSNNPVGTGTSVFFRTEAGAIPQSIATKKFDPTGNNTDEGTGTVVFSTIGVWPPVDVPPLPANPAQWPSTRLAEPSVAAGALTRNPRDALVTVIAFVRGEEHYFDDNTNGVRDANERFIDQGEPFVDSNDNGVFDPGELYIDEAPQDNQWTPPNGIWDNNTTIWTETRILYSDRPITTGLPNSFIQPNPFSTPCCSPLPDGGMVCTGGLGKGTSVGLSATFGDLNLNRPQAAGTSFAIRHTATKGTVAISNTNLLDGYGFGMERRLLDSTTSQACTAAGSPICHWRVLFYDWRRPVASGSVTGAAPTDFTLCQPDSVTIEADVLQIKTGVTSNGAIN